MGSLLAVAVLAGGVGWLVRHHAARPSEKRSTAAPRLNDEAAVNPFASHLREIAAAYQNYGLVNPTPHWAPTMCVNTPPPGPAPLVSHAASGKGHGGKLYYLYAANLDAYRRAAKGESQQAVGQVLVKESWLPRRVAAAPSHPCATGPKGELFEPAERGPLFVMFKLDPATKGTDHGWAYGTLNPDGRQVTSAGRVASCMGCHDHGTRDRLFGPAR